MSWATSYKGSNNIHFNFPPLMNDSRNYSDYQPGTNLDKKIKEQQNIKTNSEYRKYLQQNSEEIIKKNNFNALKKVSFNVSNNNNYEFTQPYIFDSILSNDQPFGYENSDLKNIYLSRQVLESKMHAPRFNLSEN